ncbi:uncharacterized protein LOC141644024 [Silene latifolia]|uniref:uncharacterized protein LOC141644024 n=1 Tax=Silene latifolia TaxID=37657 RepID=UPI003D77FF6B
MAEDCNTLVSDCIVISCCCQCLILQFVVFVFTQLPRKLARKTKDCYTKKSLRHRKTSGNEGKRTYEQTDDGRSVSMQMLELEGNAMSKLHRWGSCLDEVEKVLEGLSMKGEFAFGSFWGGNHQRENGGFLEYGDHVVQFHLIEVVGINHHISN